MDSGNKMIMVTGEPRSGTSLQMAFLRSQGIPIAGSKYLMKDRVEIETDSIILI